MMDHKAAWQLFLATGAPEAYMLYNQLRKSEEWNVPDNSRACDAGYRLQ